MGAVVKTSATVRTGGFSIKRLAFRIYPSSAAIPGIFFKLTWPPTAGGSYLSNRVKSRDDLLPAISFENIKTTICTIIGAATMLFNSMAQTIPVISSYKVSGANSLEAIIDNLTVGHSYAVLSYPTNSYPSLLFDIFNDKPIVEAVFTATGTSSTQFVAKNHPLEKLTYVVDLDTYNGPNPSIISPADGQIVSGSFNVILSGRPPLLKYKSEIYVVNNTGN